jgi:hypothetical protein
MCEVRCKYTPFMNYGLTIGITGDVQDILQKVEQIECLLKKIAERLTEANDTSNP